MSMKLGLRIKKAHPELGGTREEAYGVDLDYVLDFNEFLNKTKAIATEAMAIKWMNLCFERDGIRIKIDHPDDLVNAVVKFRKEKYLQKSFGETTVDWDSIEKAYKYIRRWMGKNGKWQYLYQKDLLYPIKAVKRLFGLEEKKTTTEYETHHIKKEYGTDKKTFVSHVLEYLSNRIKWDKVFGDRANRAKYDKPVKQKDVLAAAAVEKLNDDGSPGLFKENVPKTNIVNRSLMKKVWEIYNPQKNLDITAESAENETGSNENGEGKNRTGTGSGELPAGTPAVRDGGSEGSSDLNVSSPGETGNKGESGGSTDQSGGGSGGSVRGRRGRSAIKDIRDQVKKLLAEKKDDEFTDADKELLRQYEGGGGLAEKGATTHGTLYEFYTPQKVVDKVWQLVDKYNHRIDKTVIEPSAGTGRFAENRLEKFDLFELDQTSARIAGILHPDANIKQGYFQELFMNGRTPKKEYDGKKYDVAIGNPPYGDYSGLHRGLGEGKIHSRIEDYFIDRSLDTLKDGGILAMVVPSSFLRGKNSKGKERITSKARLLEAWRLPNGTFGTTGVGTDIIILRKEKGDPEAFNNDAYFQTHENQIIGVESDKMGRFGMEKYVAPPDGMTFDEALDSINPSKVGVTQIDELAPEVQAAADVAVSEAEEHRNRSEAMLGNDNAYKGGPKENIEKIKDRIAELEGHQEKIAKWIKDGQKTDSGGIHVFTQKQIAEMKQNMKLTEKQIVEEWEKRGAAEFKAGNKRQVPFKEIVKPGIMVGSEESKIGLKRTEAWYMGWDKANISERLPSGSTGDEHENRSQAMMGNDNAAGDRGGPKETEPGRKKKKNADDYTPSVGKNMTVDQFNEKYGIKVDKADMPIWEVADYDGRIDVARLSANDRKHMETCGRFTIDGSGNWYNIAIYASGNIYEKLDQLEKDKEALGQKNYEFNKALLEAAKLPPKPVENIQFSPISDFVKEYKYDDEEGNQETLKDAFKKWAKVETWGRGKKVSHRWDSDESPISEYEIPPNISFNDVLEYIDQKAVRSDKATAKEFDTETARMEAAKKREARRECAERLFNKFIREGMSDTMREKLVEAYNRRYFSVVNPDYSKIPVFIDGMNTHKGEKEFHFIKEQLGTTSFMCNKGNGISAADVGVGKTVIGESVTVNQIKTGRAKRPLVCVPKAVYKKWVKEFHQHFPKMVINELGNFSDKDIVRYKNDKGGLKIPKGTISVCTYEALEKVTFKDETINTDLIDDMMDSQTIYDAGVQEKRTAKELAEEKNKMMAKLGKGAKAKEGAICWEDTGFDCITVDEIHNFKNVFGEARSFSGSNKSPDDSERQANEFSGLKGSNPSDRAVKLFAITQLIQKQNNGRNVFGLSATPFTNSPIEVYNILSLVARNKLKELHIYNMHEFLAQFAEIRTEWSVVANGEIKEKQVMKNWKNLGALQNLVSEYMYRVDADEAGVIRPKKILHTPQLELTPLQRAMIKAETQYMSDADPKEDPGAALKAINYMRMATLSPAAVKQERHDFYRKNYPKLFNGLEFPTSKDFVSTSPKMKFVCNSVVKSYNKMPNAGQIIYLPRGVDDFVHVKQYLMDQGMPMDSIAFMSSKTTLDEKERIKNEFNDPNGRVKVIIGSETIKEGVSLNGNTITAYNCMLGWNPTETTQVEGRGWRQGNKQGKFHMVYPLMADSIDALMYQKYDEKKSRIDEVWSYKGDTSRDVSDINPEELKFDLIKDPAKKAKLIVGQKLEKVRGDIRIEQARYDSIFKDGQRYKERIEEIPSRKRSMDEDEAEMLECRENRDAAQKEYEKTRKSGSSQEIYRANRKLEEVKWQLERATSSYRQARKYHKECQDAIDSIRSKFNRLDIKPDRVDEKLKEIASGIQKLKNQEKSINESYREELEKAARELETQREKIPPLETLIEENVKSIMSDLRPMDDKFKAELKAELEAKRNVKKSLVILNNRLFIKVS